jgi:uncharacterized NAD(P)/FAD-binding protein YdhS
MALGGAATVVIAGGGCSGTLLAAALSAGSVDHPVDVVVVDPSPTPGRGVAYSTRCSSHLLNVPAEQMSASLDRPADFVDWAQQRDPGLSARSFVPRMLYGEYLEAVFHEAQCTSPPGSSVVHVPSTVVSAVTAHAGALVRVGLAGGRFVDADHLVLAMGNLPAKPMQPARGIAVSSRYIADPWRPGALDGVRGSMLLVGTGLTAVDVTLALADRDGIGTIHAVSRHGLLPRAHREDRLSVPPLIAPPAEATVRGLITLLRRNAADRGDWRTAVDEFRPHVSELWRSLPDVERRRFLRHVARLWEIHRHRMAPEVSHRVEHLMSSRRLRVSAGSIAAHRDLPDGVEVAVRMRGTDVTATITVAHVINCTGPQLRISDAGDPLIDSLLSSGLVRPGPYGLGLDVTCQGAVIDGSGDPSSNIWAIGPLRRGVEWETTAAREIRAQAAALGAQLSARIADVHPSPLDVLVPAGTRP